MADDNRDRYSYYKDPERDPRRPFKLNARMKEWAAYLIGCFNFIILLIIITALAQLAPVFWLCIPAAVVMFAGSLYARRNRAVEERTRDDRLSESAKSMKGDMHGTALHVAGHPLLQRDQRLTLVLAGPELRLYDEYLEKQLASIALDDIRALYTVVYDDARVPHIDVIDSAAQAIQIELYVDGTAYTALFRSMLDPRPVDWYHAIEQARYRLR